MTERLALGIDVGTSGVRAVVVASDGTVRASASAPLPSPNVAGATIAQDPALWWRAVESVLDDLGHRIDLESVGALAVDGTSGTLLLADAAGHPLGPALMYNDATGGHHATAIRDAAPPASGAHGATSTLGRLLVLQERHPDAAHALHQADWIAGRLAGHFGWTDENNALKLGYDPVRREWPTWMDSLAARRALFPEVVAAGTPVGPVAPDMARRFGLSPGVEVVAGTTDGCASFLATGANSPGDGVTALGSTLVVKLLSDAPVFAPESGVYSHRMGDRWLVGGASNAGGAALARFFAPDEMAALTPRLRPDRPIGRRWHPLPGAGERFPVNDPAMRFAPDDPPEDRAEFFQALLEGVAAVEAEAYALLARLGAAPLATMRTVGGAGASNPAWTAIRARALQVPMLEPLSTEAAFGAARLARAALPAPRP